MKVEIEDTYCEAFDGLYFRILVTADDKNTLKQAAEDITATPSVVIGRIEGGIEKYVNPSNTPDGRFGVILQSWTILPDFKNLERTVERFYKEFSYRIRQDILVKPFTSVFDACSDQIGKVDTLERIGHCGDGYEWIETKYNREMIVVPIMVPNFYIERYLGYGNGVMGGNIWYMCKTRKAVMAGGRKALEAINQEDGVIAPFGICAAGSKAETRYPQIGPTTNHPYCPSLKTLLGKDSKIQAGVNYVPEIVINGKDMQSLKNALSATINVVSKVDGVIRISAGNYKGKLGQYKIFLRDLL